MSSTIVVTVLSGIGGLHREQAAGLGSPLSRAFVEKKLHLDMQLNGFQQVMACSVCPLTCVSLTSVRG